jgi:hypothetical protein
MARGRAVKRGSYRRGIWIWIAVVDTRQRRADTAVRPYAEVCIRLPDLQNETQVWFANRQMIRHQRSEKCIWNTGSTGGRGSPPYTECS